MYLSKLDVHGFKSFADRTSLTFDPGITAVVGPNGCGKSNIVDAVRWVIGEQRARILRSDKMESVIFNGTAKKRPLGMAEVMLTIENNRGILPVEFSEITLGRRLFRSGESEYLLNGVQCRLKDITDLFMDTGMGAGAYSVIELKMIDEILSDNTADRRRLFEEAAGITRYKLRRTQTLRKLQNTQVDLNRLKDIIEEVEKRVRSLKRQAKKAAEYKEIETKLRTLELSLAKVEHDRLSAQKAELELELRGLQVELEGQTAQHGQSEASLEALRMELLERDERYAATQQLLNAHIEKVRSIESDIRLLEERIANNERDLKRARLEQDEAEQRLEQLELSIQELEVARAAAEPALALALDQLEKATVERDHAQEISDAAHKQLVRTRTREQELSDKTAESQRQLDRLVSRLELLEQDEQLSQSHEEQLDEEATAQKLLLSEAEEKLSLLRSVTEQRRMELEDALLSFERLQASNHSSQEEYRATERQLEAATAEVHLLDSLVSSYDDFSDAVQYLADRKDWSTDKLLTVSDILACDSTNRPAVEAALNGYADCVVVKSESNARAALNQLRSAGKGRATFVVLDRLTENSPQSIPPGEGTPLTSLVRTDGAAHKRLADLLLHNCFLVNSIDAVRGNETPSGARFFDNKGQWTDDRGLVHGGGDASSADAGSARIGRREQLQSTKTKLETLTLDLERLTVEVDASKAALDAVDVDRFRIAVAEHQRAEIEAEKRHAQVRFETDNLGRRQTELHNRVLNLGESIQQIRTEILNVRKTVESANESVVAIREERSGAEEAFQQAEAGNRAVLARFSEVNVAAVEARNLADNLRRDLERSRESIEDIHRRRTERDSYIADAEQQISVAQEDRDLRSTSLREQQEERPGIEQQVSAAKDLLSETRVKISNIEADLREIRKAKEDQLRAENQRAVRLAEVQTRTEELTRHIEEDYNVSINEIEVAHEEIADEKEARKEVLEMRRRVRSIGPINELALTEFEQEQERFEFLSGQHTDLLEAEKTLLATIDEINTTASNRFNETFGEIKKNFSKLFTELFGDETTADVILENPDDPLESAIDVIAKPRGKRPSVLAQLSGGEKTLTAIALLFSIYLVKPSPFCILDEVDAPLDDANIIRFMKIIREFAKSTQFILVTHNKRTMEAADRMYGVTMQEQGVSSLVGVQFEEAVEFATN